MDNLTHTLTGLALARAGLKRFSPHGTLLLLIAANLPDIDMLSWLKGWLVAMEVHRSYTHALIGLPFVAALAVILTSLFTRRKLPWRAAWLIALVGVISHVLLDWSMSYGVRFLLPFSSRWFHLDWYPLTDYVLLACLILAALAPSLGKLVSEEIGARSGNGQGFAIFALCFIVAYAGFRGAMHARVMSQLNSRIYESALGSAAISTAAFPAWVNPLSWHAVVEGEHAYRLYTLSPYGDFDPLSGHPLYKADWGSVLDRVSQDKSFRYALYFARFPYWQKSPAGEDQTKVSVTDLRFGPPGESFFTVNALLDIAGHIRYVWFGNGGAKEAE
jgi:inner membrane protein